MTTEPAIYLFVYGTLRRTCSTGAHKIYLNDAEFIGDAKLQATLFCVSYYPAIVLSDEDTWVIGEVYRLTGDKQLQALDEYEECAPPTNNNHEYKRELTQVQLANGESLMAWTYIYNRSTKELTQITSGDFLQHPPLNAINTSINY